MKIAQAIPAKVPAVDPASDAEMLAILKRQKSADAIPAGLPAGTVWRREALADPRPATPAVPPRPEPVTPTGAAAAFRNGWEALRAERYRDAIAAFDRASDPVVAEDAAYWAAAARLHK